MVSNSDIIEKTTAYVKAELGNCSAGHDWWHVYRVWQLAKKIAKTESKTKSKSKIKSKVIDMQIVELAALLHDIADWKFSNSSDDGMHKSKQWLISCGLSEKIANQISIIVRDISYKGANVKEIKLSPEGKIVRDADRLDAIGAIGIARAFAYGGAKKRVMHNPHSKPVLHTSSKFYMRGEGTTINHFYEKLLLLQDRLHTKTAKKIAVHRHKFMKEYLAEFYKEWEGLK